jgi:hypothetical protein
LDLVKVQAAKVTGPLQLLAAFILMWFFMKRNILTSEREELHAAFGAAAIAIGALASRRDHWNTVLRR